MPYITIHAQRKARAIVKLVHSIELTDELFLDSDIIDDATTTKQGNELSAAAAEEDDDIDSDDEMDDEGEELVVEGGVGSVSLVSFVWFWIWIMLFVDLLRFIVVNCIYFILLGHSLLYCTTPTLLELKTDMIYINLLASLTTT